MNRKTLSCCALLLIGLLTQGYAMAFSKTLYLFSEVEGTVLLDGKPVQGVEIEQEYPVSYTHLTLPTTPYV